MKYVVTIEPVSRNQSTVIKVLYRLFGPGSDMKKRAEELVKNGGTIDDTFHREAATALADKLRSLGAEVSVSQMEEDDSGNINATYTITLIDAGRNKLAVIKVIKEITGLSLKDCKELVDGLGLVAESTTRRAAEDIKEKLEAEGAKVDIQSTNKNEPTLEENNRNDHSDSQGQIKLIFDGTKNTVILETHSGNKIEISEMNNAFLLEDQNGNKLTLSENGVHVM